MVQCTYGLFVMAAAGGAEKHYDHHVVAVLPEVRVVGLFDGAGVPAGSANFIFGGLP